MKLYELSIQEAHRLLRKKEISSQDLTRAILDRINAVDEKVGAYITVDPETAMTQAETADKAISEGRLTPSPGFPSPSRTSFAQKVSGQPAVRRF